jgi:hypothetical protein
MAYTTNRKSCLSKPFTSLIVLMLLREVLFIGGTSNIGDCSPVAHRTPSRKRNFSLLHSPTMADSPASCAEEMACHHDTCSMHCWLRPKSAMLNTAHFIFGFLFLCSVMHHISFCKNSSSHIYQTHFLFLMTI